MIGVLSPKQIEQVLHEQVIGRIGCHALGRTYIVPITYVYADDAIISHTGVGLKVQMMRENPFVCFEVDDVSRLPKWDSVIAFGRYEELRGRVADAAYEQLVARLTASPPSANAMPWEGAGVYLPISHAQRADVIFRISFTEKTGRYDR